MKTAIVIPSLEPNFRLVELVEKIQQYQKENQRNIPIIIINDGSSREYDKLFNKTKELGCILLEHAVNLGKGRALKTAFNYYLNNYPEGIGLITADSDGQHAVEDIFACLDALEANPGKLVLGVRQFDDKTIPLRSRFGNNMTQGIFKFLCGVDVKDTQTGLRAVPTKFMKEILGLAGERFEYEMNMLIETKNLDTEIFQVPIKTIYIEENESSHFNPITDSIRIYSLFLKFLFSSTASFIVDIGLFSLFMFLLKSVSIDIIVFSTILARIGSSIFNFKSNEKLVFKNKNNSKSIPIKYFSLVIIQMLTSAFLVSFFAGNMTLNVALIKILVDGFLFLLSFQIQRNWVFK